MGWVHGSFAAHIFLSLGCPWGQGISSGSGGGTKVGPIGSDNSVDVMGPRSNIMESYAFYATKIRSWSFFFGFLFT